jgi:hypothetical protein
VAASFGAFAIATGALIAADYAADSYTRGWDSSVATDNLSENIWDGMVGLALGGFVGKAYEGISKALGYEATVAAGRHTAAYLVDGVTSRSSPTSASVILGAVIP